MAIVHRGFTQSSNAMLTSAGCEENALAGRENLSAKYAMDKLVDCQYQCFVWEMGQKAEMDITSLEMNHFTQIFTPKGSEKA